MKNTKLIILFLLCLNYNCNKTEETTPLIPKETAQPNYIETIDFSSVDGVSEIQDFDFENGNLYFIYNISIYKINLNSDTKTAKLIIEDNIDWPNSLKVIGNTLYYQGHYSWSTSQDIKQVDLNAISKGVQSTHTITGVSRSQLCKNLDELYYISSSDGFSPTNNFYKLSQHTTDKMIATDEFIIPKNMRIIDHYLYFSSNKEVRKFDLNNPHQKSSIVYTVPEIENSQNGGNIIGFDIKDNVIYFTQNLNNKIFAKDLEQPNEAPIVLKINTDNGTTGYGKLIIADEKLYVKKITDKKLEVFDI